MEHVVDVDPGANLREVLISLPNTKCEIRLSEGKYKIGESFYLDVHNSTNPIHIVGYGRKEEIVIEGGVCFNFSEHVLKNVTLFNAHEHGVKALSSFTMKDVIVKQASGHGVYVTGHGVVGQCVDVEVLDCGESGVFADEQSTIKLVELEGVTVHNNCLDKHSLNENKNNYGLKVNNGGNIVCVGNIIENVSWGNQGGGDWNDDELGEITHQSTDKQITEPTNTAAALRF
jgi:hypothetical protein